MNPLFSKSGLAMLQSLSLTKTLYAFDFDGTLSKIVRTASDATIIGATDTLLRELAQYVPVAVISGRSLQDLKMRLKFQPRYLIGNHGIEGFKDSEEALESAERINKEWIKSLTQEELGAGVEIEDKHYSLAIHYRHAVVKQLVREKIRAAISRLDPAPRTIPGKLVVNLLPPGAPHKGLAVLELMRITGADQALYVGDDDTDEDVFNLSDPRVVGIRVGTKSSSHADYFIQRQAEIDRLLEILIQNQIGFSQLRA